jgi:serine/threonine-protein kinase
VTAVLEGSVRRAGSRIRVAAQLVDVRTGYHLWSERYDRQMQDVFDLQDDPSRAIAGTLQVKLLAGSDAPLVTPATGDVEAYNHYLKGRYFFNRREAKSAISEFEEAIARDPEYVPAHTGLADSYCVYGFYGGIDTRVAFAKAKAAADQAKKLAPSSPETHLAIALIEHYYGWDLDAFDRECKAAIAAAPGFAAAHSWLSLGWAARGSASHRENALEACRLEPFSANFQANVGWTYFHAERDFARALTEFRRALAIEPDALYPLWGSAMTLRLLGEHAEAVATIERARALAGDQSFYVGLHGALLAAAGRRDEARALLASLQERSGHEYVAPFHTVALHVELGDVDAGIRALERAIEERNGLAYWVSHNAIFDPLKSDPRFPAIVARVVPA